MKPKPIILVWILILLSFFGLALVYFIENLEEKRAADAVQKGEFEFTLAAKTYRVPKKWVETFYGQENGALSSLQLKVPFQLNGQTVPISVSLLPSSKAAPSAYLLDALYIHNFSDAPSNQAFGLIVKKLKAQDGYEHESVWYDALSSNPFVAKCLSEPLGETTKHNCVTTILINKRVSALVQFDGLYLPVWRELHAELAQFAKSLNEQ